MNHADVEEELDAEISELESTVERRDEKITDLEEQLEAKDTEIEELKARDVHAYLEENPEQLLDVLVPADVATELFRERVIDCNTASGLTLGEFFDLLTE